MQYNSEIYTYQRNRENTKGKINAKILFNVGYIKLTALFLCSILISRVILINHTAPFGIAFLMSVLINKEVRSKIIAMVGTLIGYLTIQNTVSEYYTYIIAAGIITFISLFTDKYPKKKMTVVYSALLMAIFVSVSIIFSKTSFNMAVFIALLQVLCILPVYYIINKSILCFENVKTRHLFTNEELICMTVTMSLVISGTQGFKLYNISITNIIALLSIIIVTYINGLAIGTTIGVTNGIIIGMSTNKMEMYIAVFAICAIVSGIFKGENKWITGISFSIVFLIMLIYTRDLNNFNPIEGILASGVFILIPSKIIEKIKGEINVDNKQQNISENYIEKVKNIYIKRLDDFSKALNGMGGVLNSLAENDKLSLKTKSSGIIENLADRVCNNCNMKNICWKRELYYTYAAFEELISNYQDNKGEIPHEIIKKCIKKNSLIASTEEIVNNYVSDEMWRAKLGSGRRMIAGEINNVSEILNEMNNGFKNNINFNYEMEKKIISVFLKTGIKFNDVMCINDETDRINIKISMHACGGRQICVKKILPLINEVTNTCMCIRDDGCKIDPKTELCSVEFEKTPKYYMVSYVSRKNKYGEKENGDSYSFGKNRDENYMIAISDGMGSGGSAGRESKAAIDLIEKFTHAGIDKLTAINCINSVMTLKFSEDEKFSTMDLCGVDLYSGEASFMKVGAAPSFIKRKDRVEIINSRTLPIGVLDEADIDIKNKNLQNGDIIVMLSDGVTDFDNNNAGKTGWIEQYLKNASSNNPKELVEELVKKSLELGKGRAKDDITAIVSKVYSLY
ncbi:MAG: stage II sporulation protein E [Clostridium sp.]|nr:stage II sporulation protein E [Clostridium sp.]